jgi:hypothetical protein
MGGVFKNVWVWATQSAMRYLSVLMADTLAFAYISPLITLYLLAE